MMHTGYYTFVQTHRLYNTKNASSGKLQAVGDYEVSV